MVRVLGSKSLFCLVAVCVLGGFASGVLSAQDRPMIGAAEGSIVGQLPPNGLLVSASGQATHLGQFDRTEVLYLNLDGSFSGQIIFRAADGDELCTNVVGQFVSATDAVGQYQFAGGTGRFSTASGEAEFQAHTPDGLRVFVQFRGLINY